MGCPNQCVFCNQRLISGTSSFSADNAEEQIERALTTLSGTGRYLKEKNPDVKNLAVRNWACPVCGAEHDRDINAARNILNKGLEMLAS